MVYRSANLVLFTQSLMPYFWDLKLDLQKEFPLTPLMWRRLHSQPEVILSVKRNTLLYTPHYKVGKEDPDTLGEGASSHWLAEYRSLSR